VHTREFPFGNAVAFYPEATEHSCSAAIEGLERFVQREPLRVHECVFGVLALESEPVDPRL
jgi:hypothetical protein